MLTAIVDTGAGPNLLKENYVPRSWARPIVSMMATCLWSAANAQLKVKVVIRLIVSLRQKIAETSFPIAINLATDMTLEAAYINKNNEEISPKEDTPKPTGLSSVSTEESVGNAAYLTGKMETNQNNSKDEYNAYQCLIVRQKILPPMSDAYLQVRSNA